MVGVRGVRPPGRAVRQMALPGPRLRRGPPADRSTHGLSGHADVAGPGRVHRDDLVGLTAAELGAVLAAVGTGDVRVA